MSIDGKEADRLHRQMSSLAQFGGHALQVRDLDALLHEACELVAEVTGVELVKVLELLPDGDTMLVRAGVNWRPGVVGHATLPAHEGSPSGYALDKDEPVISRDTDREDRFEIPTLMRDHDVKSMVNVVIKGESVWGVLEIDARHHCDFDEHDASFLQSFANLLAAAIERVERESELEQALKHREILLEELQHRVRNILMNIQALAKRTKRRSRDLEAFGAAFDARLQAVARTQELLSRGAVGRLTLNDTLRQELLAHGAEEGDRVRLAGPEIEVPPKVSQALGMAFHELATNSVKYGALGRHMAQLDVAWRLEEGAEGAEILIRWRETGVRIDGPPSRRGFGSETIERSLPHMLGGEVRQIFHPDGLECIIRLPDHDKPEGVRDAPAEG
jgi:two-component sensor histidine kinase